MIHSKSENDHTNHLRIVVIVFKDNSLFAKFGKCEFLLKLVAILGHIVIDKVLEMDLEKNGPSQKFA